LADQFSEKSREEWLETVEDDNAANCRLLDAELGFHILKAGFAVELAFVALSPAVDDILTTVRRQRRLSL